MKKQTKLLLLVLCLTIYTVLSPLAMAVHYHHHSDCVHNTEEEVCVVCFELATRPNLITPDDFDICIKTSVLCVRIYDFYTLNFPHKTLFQLFAMQIE